MFECNEEEGSYDVVVSGVYACMMYTCAPVCIRVPS